MGQLGSLGSQTTRSLVSVAARSKRVLCLARQICHDKETRGSSLTASWDCLSGLAH